MSCPGVEPVGEAGPAEDSPRRVQVQRVPILTE